MTSRGEQLTDPCTFHGEGPFWDAVNNRLLLWLAADDSRACTAQRWIVDGGWQ